MSNEISQDSLYGDYREMLKAKEKLHLRAAHKALNIPEDDMQINANRTGLGPLGAIGIALVSSLVPGGFLLWSLLGQAASQLPTPNASKPPDSEYEVRFYDKDGKLINVPHISQR